MSSAPPADGSPESIEDRADGTGAAAGDFLSNFDPELVHRVLLTDPAEFRDLTMSGAPRPSRTPSFEQFAREIGFIPKDEGEGGGEAAAAAAVAGGIDVAAQISKTIKRAFLDMAASAAGGEAEAEAEEPNLEPLKGLILELHAAIRSLIPHRTDLHGRLSDEDVQAAGTSESREGGGGKAVVLELVPHLVRAADALTQLESEDRSETTRHWIEMVTETEGGGGSVSHPPPPLDMSPARFVTASAAYLHHKAEMCQADIADFKLGHVLAPRIHADGGEYERSNFRRRFGDFDSDGTAPVTREWISRIVDGCSGDGDAAKEELRRSEEMRAAAVRTGGWVDELLFGGGSTGGDEGMPPVPIAVPEVLLLDVPHLRGIREIVRRSVAGSVLALHACTVAGVGDNVLRTDHLPDDIKKCRDGLAGAMANRMVGSQEQYERNVSCSVIELARTLQPTFDASREESLVSRTTAVLRGEDPVIKLLDSRMREVFRLMMEWEPTDSSRVPLSMKTGRNLTLGARADSTRTYGKLFKEAAQREFERKGFAFYAPELASASLLATKIINLVFVLYGEAFLEPVFLQALQ